MRDGQEAIIGEPLPSTRRTCGCTWLFNASHRHSCRTPRRVNGTRLCVRRRRGSAYVRTPSPSIPLSPLDRTWSVQLIARLFYTPIRLDRTSKNAPPQVSNIYIYIHKSLWRKKCVLFGWRNRNEQLCNFIHEVGMKYFRNYWLFRWLSWYRYVYMVYLTYIYSFPISFHILERNNSILNIQHRQIELKSLTNALYEKLLFFILVYE